MQGSTGYFHPTSSPQALQRVTFDRPASFSFDAGLAELQSQGRPVAFFSSPDSDLSILAIGPFERLECAPQDFYQKVENRGQEIHQRAQPGRPFSGGCLFLSIAFDQFAAQEASLHASRKAKSAQRSEAFVAHRLLVQQGDQLQFIDFQSSSLNESQDLLSTLLHAKPRQGQSPSTYQSIDFPATKMGPVVFAENVAKLREHIRAGDIFQAVLSDRMEIRSSSHPLQVFSKLKSLQPKAYNFYIPLADGGQFLGASPESLLEIHQSELRTHPIAGTKPRGKCLTQDAKNIRQLKRSKKEAAEHLMLVDLARNDLGKSAMPGSVRVTSFREVRKLSHVIHLVSEVRATRRQEVTPLQALQNVFPAGTLSGAPKIRAVEILGHLESESRGFFGGAVAVYDGNEELHSCISIRAIEFQGSTAILRAGAGIVLDSKPENEYAEIQQKMKLPLQAVLLAEGKSL